MSFDNRGFDEMMQHTLSGRMRSTRGIEREATLQPNEDGEGAGTHVDSR